MLKKYYLDGFFWVPILHKCYQNTSRLPTDNDYQKNNDNPIFKKLMLLQKKLHLAMEKMKSNCYSNLSTN